MSDITNINHPTGWICPVCGCGLSPWAMACPCTKTHTQGGPYPPKPWRPQEDAPYIVTSAFDLASQFVNEAREQEKSNI
jgi:hypothetical protein